MILVNESHHQVAWTVAKLRPPGFTATFVAKGTYSLKAGGAAVPVLPQPPLCGDVHVGEDPSLPLRYASDFVPTKPRADVLLVGHAWVPGGKPTDVLRVTFQVGKFKKTLAVIGDRVRQHKVVTRVNTPPDSFVKMPLDYVHAFGGAGFKLNPLGKGHAEEIAPDGKTIRRLPNVEHIEALMLDSDSMVDPAGYGPFPISWPQRMRKAGTYNKKWLKERWPWFAEDIDWSVFNAAPESQQIKGYLKGDEELRFENLHPGRPVYEGALPGLRVRCFFAPEGGFRPKPREVPMNLDTLWACPEEDKLVLVWRGTVDAPGEILPERGYLVVASEPVKEPPKSAEHYERLLVAKIFDEVNNPPPLDIVPGPKLPPFAPDVAKPAPGVPVDVAVPDEPLPVELAEIVAKAPPTPPPPPVPPYAAFAAQMAAAGIKVPAEEPEPPVEEPKAAAVAEPPGPTRAWCLERVARGEGLADLDLSGVDLSGADLSSVSFQGSVLGRANLSGANLSGSDFSDAILAGADLRKADLRRAILLNADATGAFLQEANLLEAVVEGADFGKAKLDHAVLVKIAGKGALFSEARLRGANLQGADLSGADLSRALLAKANLRDAKLVEASLQGAVGHGVMAEGADFTKAKAGGANFGESNFKNLKGPGSVWAQAQLFRSDFSGASLEDAIFSGAYLCQARFAAADLRRAKMDEANLRKAMLIRIHFLQGSFQKANLTSADLGEANLFQAEFYGAITKEASFQGANVKRTLLAAQP